MDLPDCPVMVRVLCVLLMFGVFYFVDLPDCPVLVRAVVCAPNVWCCLVCGPTRLPCDG